MDDNFANHFLNKSLILFPKLFISSIIKNIYPKFKNNFGTFFLQIFMFFGTFFLQLEIEITLIYSQILDPLNIQDSNLTTSIVSCIFFRIIGN
jgi:hypothetical protein